MGTVASGPCALQSGLKPLAEGCGPHSPPFCRPCTVWTPFRRPSLTRVQAVVFLSPSAPSFHHSQSPLGMLLPQAWSPHFGLNPRAGVRHVTAVSCPPGPSLGSGTAMRLGLRGRRPFQLDLSCRLTGRLARGRPFWEWGQPRGSKQGRVKANQFLTFPCGSPACSADWLLLLQLVWGI